MQSPFRATYDPRSLYTSIRPLTLVIRIELKENVVLDVYSNKLCLVTSGPCCEFQYLGRRPGFP